MQWSNKARETFERYMEQTDRSLRKILENAIINEHNYQNELLEEHGLDTKRRISKKVVDNVLYCQGNITMGDAKKTSVIDYEYRGDIV